MIIGIAGPSGAGKDTAAEYLAAKFRFSHISGGDVLRQIFVELGLEPTKPAIGDFAQLLRTHFGADAIIQAVIAMTKGKDTVVSGFRSPAETKVVQENGGLIIYIDAPEAVRHARILERARPGDPVDTEGLAALEAREASMNAAGENVAAMKETADIVIVNDGSAAELYSQLDAALKEKQLSE